MKKSTLTTILLPFVILGLFLFISPPNTSAVGIVVKPLDDSNNPISKLDENAARAQVTFTGLPDNNYFICLGWADLGGSDCADSGVNHFRHDLGAVTGGIKTIIVCATSVDGIPGLLNNLPGLKMDNCNSGDYFHAHDYRIKLEPRGGSNVTWENGVSVDRFIPNATFSTTTPKPTDNLSFTIDGPRRPFGDSGRNSYEFEFKRDDGLLTPPSLSGVAVHASGSSPQVNIGTLQAGAYTLKIRVTNGPLNHNYDDKWYSVDRIARTVHIKVDDTSGSITGASGTSGTATGDGTNPCDASGCQTALGLIPTSAKEFAARILGIATGIAGGIALILMVIGSIRVLASSGDPKAVGAGREMIVAAVAGLLFLIFAVLILRFIGINIFSGVPGMGT